MTVNQGPQDGSQTPGNGDHSAQPGGIPPQPGGVPAYANAFPAQGGGVPPYNGGYPPQQGGFPPQPPQKKPVYKRVWFWIVVAVAFFVLVGALTGGDDSGPGSGATSGSTTAVTNPAVTVPAVPETEDETTATKKPAQDTGNDKTLEFHATATGSGSVVWGSDGSTNTEDFTGEWSKTLTGDEASGYYTLFVSGDIMSGDSQEMTCEIVKNGKTVDSNKGTGSAGSASCSVFG